MKIMRIAILLVSALFLFASDLAAIPRASSSTPPALPTPQSTAEPNRAFQIEAIESLQRHLNIALTPIEFVETTTMVNSPSGDMLVALYQDSQGRRYLVEPTTNRVVEIDARALIPSFLQSAPCISMDDLRSKAERIISATTDDFPALRQRLAYDEGAKGDFYFFNWVDEDAPGSMNRPFAQISFHCSGELIAYYNSLGFR